MISEDDLSFTPFCPTRLGPTSPPSRGVPRYSWRFSARGRRSCDSANKEPGRFLGMRQSHWMMFTGGQPSHWGRAGLCYISSWAHGSAGLQAVGGQGALRRVCNNRVFISFLFIHPDSKRCSGLSSRAFTRTVGNTLGGFKDPRWEGGKGEGEQEVCSACLGNKISLHNNRSNAEFFIVSKFSAEAKLPRMRAVSYVSVYRECKKMSCSLASTPSYPKRKIPRCRNANIHKKTKTTKSREWT
ncbi:hypothetical protein F5883DRAFT_140866 [Diaporthe sp. PMI_573]|nr:hypothetical protein F5883DRAFT_140866 [Diaporthaceae sp. PMI_573]